MEGAHPPLLADLIAAAPYAGNDFVVAPLFLSPGRHAGPAGDIAQICGAARSRSHLTELVGTHPMVADALAGALRTTLSNVQAHSFA
jgi:sirohydrochlorin ferrochelatase